MQGVSGNCSCDCAQANLALVVISCCNIFNMVSSQLMHAWLVDPGIDAGGERKRLQIAMALVHGLAMVFMDEPTSGQCSVNVSSLFYRFDNLCSRLFKC